MIKLFRPKQQTTIVAPTFYERLADLPIQKWIDLNDTGDRGLLLISGIATKKQIDKAWHNINNEYLQKFGLNEDINRTMKTKKEINLNLSKFLETGDRHYEMEAKLLQNELLEENKGSKTFNWNDLTTDIERFMGFSLDLDVVSTEKYYGYANKLEKHNKSLIKANENGKKV
jgi:hypothetical protein